MEWWWSDFTHYDIVYKSKVFSDTYSQDVPDPLNADVVIKGGTGYCITTVDGKEIYDKAKDHQLSPEVERCFPDYSLYPQYHYAVAMTSRGCPRKFPFCHVYANHYGVKMPEGACLLRGGKLGSCKCFCEKFEPKEGE